MNVITASITGGVKNSILFFNLRLFPLFLIELVDIKNPKVHCKDSQNGTYDSRKSSTAAGFVNNTVLIPPVIMCISYGNSFFLSCIRSIIYKKRGYHYPQRSKLRISARLDFLSKSHYPVKRLVHIYPKPVLVRFS